MTVSALAVATLLIPLAGLVAPRASHAQASDAEAIREVIASAYIDGIHRNGSREEIRAGFHPSFVMKVLDEGEVVDVTIEAWIERLPAEGSAPNRTVTHRVPQVDVSGHAASAKVEVLFDDRLVFSDYMLLYRFEEGWRIVGKVFNTETD